MTIPLTRRPATEADVPFLLRLRRESMDRHLGASGASTEESDHLDRIRHRLDCADILLDDGDPVGLLKVARDGDAWTVIQIQLAAAVRGRGIGRTLLEQIIAEARAAGATLGLSVLKANPARALYERLGFVVIGESGHEYVMRLRD